MTADISRDLLATLRDTPSPFTQLIGLRIETLTPDEVTAVLTVDPARHLHPWGAVHGGVYSSMIETLATLGAQMSALPAGKMASGIENHTSFLRQVREGQLRGRATPISRGRQLHLWDVSIRDDLDRPVAHGLVRLALLDLPSDKSSESAPAEPQPTA